MAKFEFVFNYIINTVVGNIKLFDLCLVNWSVSFLIRYKIHQLTPR